MTSPNNFRKLNFWNSICKKTGPCQSFSRFASQVGNCKFVLVILIIHERRNLLRWRWTWIPNPCIDDKRRFCTPHVAFSGIPFISTVVGTRHCCKRLWHQTLLQAPTLGGGTWLCDLPQIDEQASVSPNKRPQPSAPNRIGFSNTELLISPRPPDSYNSTARNATEPRQQLTNISSKVQMLPETLKRETWLTLLLQGYPDWAIINVNANNNCKNAEIVINLRPPNPQNPATRMDVNSINENRKSSEFPQRPGMLPEN